MFNHGIVELIINQRPSSISKRKSKSVTANPTNFSAFGTSCRKVSKFDVVDPLNSSLVTPGPGKYKETDEFQYKTKYNMRNFEKLEEQYNTQRFFEDFGAKVIFKRPKKENFENLNTVHPSEPKISFTKVSGDRKL